MDRLNGKFYEKKLSFILNAKKNLSLLTNKVLFELFGKDYSYKYGYCVDTILNYKFIASIESIINTLIIAKKKIPMTDKELQEYISSNNLKPPVINFNIKNEKGSTLFLHSFINCHSFYIISEIISYSEENNIILNLNEQNNEGFYPFLYNIYYRDVVRRFELLINYARKNKIVLEMNRQDKNGNNAIFNSIKRIYENKYVHISNYNETYITNKLNEIYKAIKLLFDYAKETNYILDLNEKDNEGNFPLLHISHNTDYIRKDITKN